MSGVLPIEIVVTGRPATMQSSAKKKASWKAAVADAAKEVWGSSPPTRDEVFFSLETYFNVDPPDVDNLLKPAQDALDSIVWVDDNQVMATLSVRRPMHGGALPVPVRSAVVDAIATGRDFVVIRVSAARAPHFNLP